LHVDLELPEQCRNAVLFGPSGSGKTLTLRALAGLLKPDEGFIRLGTKTLFDAFAGINVPARRRKLGFMFQDYALFPHLSLEDNVAFGLTGLSGRQSAETLQQVRQWLEFFDLSPQARLKPADLSGGQKQRAALARVMAVRPRLLLLDEPFSSLDPLLRGRLRQEFRELLARLDVPALFITHDPADVEMFADQLALYENGRIKAVLPFRERYAGEDAASALEKLLGG
jgi:molybdate transport system ATP-binding protein